MQPIELIQNEPGVPAMPRCATATILAVAATFALSACHRPQGPVMNYTGASDTFYSYEYLPTTVTLLDTRTEEVIFHLDIPVGKQLSLQFLDGEGDDPVYTPDLMVYEVWDQKTEFGKLRNSITVPSADVRRLDVSYRPAPEQRPEPAEMQFATEGDEQPDWWSSTGGETGDDTPAVNIYDD
jgi:hypothetical protein